MKANSPSSCAPLRHQLRARPQVGDERRREQTTRQSTPPSAAASGLGPKSAARLRGVESKLPVQLHPPPPPPPGQDWSRRRGKQTPRPAAPLSAAASGPGPTSAASGVESKLPVQLCPCSPFALVESKLPVHLSPLPSPPQGQALIRRREA